MKDWVKVALDCGLLNYVDHDNQNYFIDGYADVNTVRQFAHDLTAELVAENGRLDTYTKELLYDSEQKYAEIQRLLRMVGK